MKNAARLAVCGISTALSVVLLFLGGISSIFAYAVPMLVGLFMIMIKTTFGSSSAWITFTATSILAFFLVAEKECMLMYVLFFGFYPIIQPDLNKIKFTPLRVLLKLVIFNAMLTVTQLILVYAFGIPFLEEGEGKIVIIIFAVLMNIIFIINDKLLTVLYVLYKCKIEKRIKNLFK
ncbi:MAG: hypothetical protein ACI4IQ_02855 [Eubacterium sp.]